MTLTHAGDVAGNGTADVALPAARLRGRDCAIRQVSPTDYDWLYELHMEPANLMTYRFGGLPPSPERFAQLLWAGVACQ